MGKLYLDICLLKWCQDSQILTFSNIIADNNDYFCAKTVGYLKETQKPTDDQEAENFEGKTEHESQRNVNAEGEDTGEVDTGVEAQVF